MQAMNCLKNWVETQGIKGVSTKLFADPGKEPLLMITIEGDAKAQPVLCYGHLDKMPHLDPSGWAEGLSATNPVVRGDKVYGRGVNDDCYNCYCICTAIKYLQSKGLPHPKMIMLYESGEESGSEQIDDYLKELRNSIGEVGVILVPDAEAEDYKTLWCCTSLRGVVMGQLTVEHLSTPCHSGMATGLVPDTFRLARLLVSRIEDEATGEIKLKEAHLSEIPASRVAMCGDIAKQL